MASQPPTTVKPSIPAMELIGHRRAYCRLVARATIGTRERALVPDRWYTEIMVRNCPEATRGLLNLGTDSLPMTNQDASTSRLTAGTGVCQKLSPPQAPIQAINGMPPITYSDRRTQPITPEPAI